MSTLHVLAPIRATCGQRPPSKGLIIGSVQKYGGIVELIPKKAGSLLPRLPVSSALFSLRSPSIHIPIYRTSFAAYQLCYTAVATIHKDVDLAAVLDHSAPSSFLCKLVYLHFLRYRTYLHPHLAFLTFQRWFTSARTRSAAACVCFHTISYTNLTRYYSCLSGLV